MVAGFVLLASIVLAAKIAATMASVNSRGPGSPRKGGIGVCAPELGRPRVGGFLDGSNKQGRPLVRLFARGPPVMPARAGDS